MKITLSRKKVIEFPDYYLEKGYVRAYTEKQYEFYCRNEYKAFFYDMKKKIIYTNDYYEVSVGDYDDGQGGFEQQGYCSTKHRVMDN